MILEQTLDAIIGVSREYLIVFQICGIAIIVLLLGFIGALACAAVNYFNEKDDDIFDAHFVTTATQEPEADIRDAA